MDSLPRAPDDSGQHRRYAAYCFGILIVFSVLFGALFVLDRMLTDIVTEHGDRNGWSKFGLCVFAALMTCVFAYMAMMPGWWLVGWSKLIDPLEPLGNPFRRERDVPNAIDPALNPVDARPQEARDLKPPRPLGVLDRWWRELVGPPSDPDWESIEKFSRVGYRHYLETTSWRRKRAYLFAKAGHRCERCGGSGRLQLHHKNYKRVGHERYSDLEVLCRGCHAATHGKLVDS